MKCGGLRSPLKCLLTVAEGDGPHGNVTLQFIPARHRGDQRISDKDTPKLLKWEKYKIEMNVSGVSFNF